MSTINCLSLYFRKNITCLKFGLLEIGQIITVACIIMYGWVTANCCFMSGINDQEITKIIGTFEQHAKHEFNCRWKIFLFNKTENIAYYYTQRLQFVSEWRAVIVFKYDIYNHSEHTGSDSCFVIKVTTIFLQALIIFRKRIVIILLTVCYKQIKAYDVVISVRLTLYTNLIN